MYWLGSNLAPGATYYWRIDGVEADGTTIHTGPVWSFTAASLTAHTPSPADGAKWVDAGVDPGWTAGIGALMHDVYFGTDQEAVANGTGDTFKGTQPLLSFDPGPLAENTTYYWRVDEIEPDGTTKHDGHVWRFTTVGPGGGIEGQYYHYSGGAPNPPQAAFETLVLTRVDARVDFIFGSGSPDPKVNNDSFAIKWVGDVDIAFAEPYTFSTNTDDGLRLWVNDRLVVENWTLHGDTIDVGKPIELAGDQQVPIEMWYFENSSGAVVQLFWQSPSTPRQIIPQAAFSLPLRARGSKPRNGSTDVTQHPVLRWTAGRQAAQHDVYFGEDADAVANATPATADIYLGRQELEEVSLDPGALAWGKTYYWRIDEVNEANADSPWKGPLWSFTTADFIVVDDFESYTDDEGNRIYETWIDGWTNDTGSQAGYSNAPFAEQVIVRTGDQSMPMAYDNAASPWYSQIERSWDTPQDWTANGVDTLRLYVRGEASNVEAPLYVTIEDNAGHSGTVSYTDAAIVTTTKWAEWKVPLSEFSAAGVDLADVGTMRIGAGNQAAPTPGGAGLVYIDDIRVTKP